MMEWFFLPELRTSLIISHFNPGDRHLLKWNKLVVEYVKEAQENLEFQGQMVCRWSLEDIPSWRRWLTPLINTWFENRNRWHVDSFVTFFEAHVAFTDIAWLELWKIRQKAVRKAFLIYRMVGRKTNIEHEVKSSRFRENAYITNINPLTSIYIWESVAWFGFLHRRPMALHCKLSIVNIKTSPNRKEWNVPIL